jgi:hypothetical protein
MAALPKMWKSPLSNEATNDFRFSARNTRQGGTAFHAEQLLPTEHRFGRTLQASLTKEGLSSGMACFGVRSFDICCSSVAELDRNGNRMTDFALCWIQELWRSGACREDDIGRLRLDDIPFSLPSDRALKSSARNHASGDRLDKRTMK